MDPFARIPADVMLNIFDFLNPTMEETLQLMQTSRHWREYMPLWTWQQQPLFLMSAHQLQQAQPLTQIGEQLRHIAVSPMDPPPLVALNLQQVLLAIQRLNLPFLRSLSLPPVTGNLLRALMALIPPEHQGAAFEPSLVTSNVEELSLSFTTNDVNLAYLMYHFPSLRQLTLMWPQNPPRARFFITGAFPQLTPPATFGHLEYLDLRAHMRWVEMPALLGYCQALKVLRLDLSNDTILTQVVQSCPSLQCLYFDHLHADMPPLDLLPLADDLEPNTTHLQKVIGINITMVSAYRAIMNMLTNFQHVRLNLLRLRIGGRHWAEGTVLIPEPELAFGRMPLLQELVYDIHERARAVTTAFLARHVNPLITASNGLTACCIRVAHKNATVEREFQHDEPPLIPGALMNTIANSLPQLQHLCLHSSNIPQDAVALLRQLRDHGVALRSFDWMGENLEEIELFQELGDMSHLEWLALATRRREEVEPQDMRAYLQALSASNTITWLVFSNVVCFAHPNIFPHIPPTVNNLNLYDCLAINQHDIDFWRDAQPGRQYHASNAWAMHDAPAMEQPPLRSFILSYEGRYGQ